MTEEIKETEPNGSKALVVRETNLSFADIQSMGDAFYNSGMFPTVKSAAQAVVKIQAGRELGLGPVYSMQHLYFVDGKLGMAAETMGALLKKSGKYNYRVKEHTDQKCSITFFENGQEVYISTFTMADARRAKLIKPGGAWEKYPRALLFSRAVSQGQRIVGPDAGLGYTLEELESIEPVPDVTPAEGVNTATPTPIPTHLEEGSEPETPEVTSDNPYASYLYKCPCGQEWQEGQYGMSHQTENKSYHRLSVIIREEADRLFTVFAGETAFTSEARGKGKAWFPTDAFKEFLVKYDSGGLLPTWSKIPDETKIDILWSLQKEVDAIGKGETSPLVEEAKKLGAVEVDNAS